jgi:hypothetical protein
LKCMRINVAKSKMSKEGNSLVSISIRCLWQRPPGQFHQLHQVLQVIQWRERGLTRCQRLGLRMQEM